MVDELAGTRVAILMANEGVERIELVEPRAALEQAGATVTLVAPKAESIQLFDHLDKADTVTADRATADVSAADFDGLMLPGGVANPDQLRTDEPAVRFVRSFFDEGKPVAAICHAPWTLVEAGVVEGRVVTSWPSLQTDLRNAGARDWVDEEVVVCDHAPSLLVTSRKPDDLPRFNEAMVETFARGKREAAAVAASPGAGVLDPQMIDPPEPSEPG